MLSQGRSVKKDVPRAPELFEKACLLLAAGCLREPSGCVFWGADASQDTPKAFNFYGIACHNGLKPACADLGAIYERGIGEAVKADESEAASLFSEADDVRGCLNLARRLESGDKKQAVALRQKAQNRTKKSARRG